MNGDEAPWLDGIEGEHVRALILSDAPVICVIAGPGSGKTTGIKRRVQRLVQGEAVTADRIFVGTFTRAIATELRAALGEEIPVSTLHSLARRLLRDNPAALGGRRLRFLLRYEEDCLLYDVARGVEEPYDQRQRRDLLNRTQSSRSERTALPNARFAGLVDRWLRDHGGMLIGDVVPLALDALGAGDIPRGRFDHVFIDEYQDLTAAEQAMVELVWSGRGSLVVLGDNDQSIYSFRFNHPGGITEFAARMEAASYEVLTLSLPENRRCGTSIVELANLMMAEAGSTNDPMIAQRDDVGSSTPVHWTTLEEEVGGLAAHMRNAGGTRFLVLVPRRFIGHRLAELIGPDARTAFHQEVLEHPVVQERFTLGLLLANPNDRVALRAWLGFRGDSAEPHPTRNAAAYASIHDAGRPVDGLLAAVAAGEVVPRGEGQANVRRRVERLQELRARAPVQCRAGNQFHLRSSCHSRDRRCGEAAVGRTGSHVPTPQRASSRRGCRSGDLARDGLRTARLPYRCPSTARDRYGRTASSDHDSSLRERAGSRCHRPRGHRRSDHSGHRDRRRTRGTAKTSLRRDNPSQAGACGLVGEVDDVRGRDGQRRSPRPGRERTWRHAPGDTGQVDSLARRNTCIGRRSRVACRLVTLLTPDAQDSERCVRFA
jgi:hypothetical protein